MRIVITLSHTGRSFGHLITASVAGLGTKRGLLLPHGALLLRRGSAGSQQQLREHGRRQHHAGGGDAAGARRGLALLLLAAPQRLVASDEVGARGVCSQAGTTAHACVCVGGEGGGRVRGRGRERGAHSLSSPGKQRPKACVHGPKRPVPAAR